MNAIAIFLTVWALLLCLILWVSNRTYSKPLHDSLLDWFKYQLPAFVISSVLYVLADVFITVYTGGHNL